MLCLGAVIYHCWQQCNIDSVYLYRMHGLRYYDLLLAQMPGLALRSRRRDRRHLHVYPEGCGVGSTVFFCPAPKGDAFFAQPRHEQGHDACDVGDGAAREVHIMVRCHCSSTSSEKLGVWNQDVNLR